MADIILGAKRGNLNKVLLELREGAEVDFQDEEQATALYWACCSGHADITQLLLDRGADANLPVNWGSTALHAAADRGHMQCIKLLLRYGAFVNAVNSSGDTALHLAAYRGHQEVCRILVGHQADHFIVNTKGKTPQLEAQAGEHTEIAMLLAHKKTDQRPRSFPQQHTVKEQINYSVPLTAKQLSAWEKAQRSASYPLDHSDISEKGHNSKSKQARCDELAIPGTEDKRSSLRREILRPQVNKRVGVKNIPCMNQLSQDTHYDFHYHHHRPYSDPTALLHREELNIDDRRIRSDPTKQSNFSILDDAAFQRKQQQAERQHHAEVVDKLQVKIALLVSQNEALEKKLKVIKQRSGEENTQPLPYQVEEEKRKLENQVKELMSQVEQERRDRSDADSRSKELALELEQESRDKHEANARSRQLASELFQRRSVKTLPSLEKSKQDQNALQKNFAFQFCCSSNKLFLNSPTDLEQVLVKILEDHSHDNNTNLLASLKTAARQKLGAIATDFAKCTDLQVLSEPGKPWERDKDYKFVNPKPIDNQLRRKEDGLATEVTFKINCQSKMAAMKIILNYGRAPSFSTEVHYGTEWEILSALAPHSNVTKVLHWYGQPINDIKEQIESLLNTSLGPFPDIIPILIMPEYCVSLKALCTIFSGQDIGERCILKILLALVKAVYYLKNNGLVHRDIEPSNIFVDQHLRVILGEFGLARRVVNESNQPIPFVEKSQIMAGNPLAWAPELTHYISEGPPKSYQKQITLVDIYDASDIFAIAMSVCHILDQTPQKEENTPGINSRSGAPNQPQIPSYLSSELQSLLTAMLQKNPQDRPSLQEAILRVSMLLFGPRQDSSREQADYEAWIEAQVLRLLAVAPTIKLSNTQEKNDDFDELAKRIEWELCYEYVTKVTALQLWELCQDDSQ